MVVGFVSVLVKYVYMNEFDMTLGDMNFVTLQIHKSTGSTTIIAQKYRKVNKPK